MRGKRFIRRFLIALAMVWVALEAAAIFVAWPRQPAAAATNGKQDPAKVEAETAALRKKIGALAPKAPYIVIDSANTSPQGGQRGPAPGGRELRPGSIRRSRAARGSGYLDTSTRRIPQVKSKVVDLTWIKPDWAFIEEGKEIPKKGGKV
jgi:L,D-transpeptidase YbiS